MSKRKVTWGVAGDVHVEIVKRKKSKIKLRSNSMSNRKKLYDKAVDRMLSKGISLEEAIIEESQAEVKAAKEAEANLTKIPHVEEESPRYHVSIYPVLQDDGTYSVMLSFDGGEPMIIGNFDHLAAAAVFIRSIEIDKVIAKAA